MRVGVASSGRVTGRPPGKVTAEQKLGEEEGVGIFRGRNFQARDGKCRSAYKTVRRPMGWSREGTMTCYTFGVFSKERVELISWK